MLKLNGEGKPEKINIFVFNLSMLGYVYSSMFGYVYDITITNLYWHENWNGEGEPEKRKYWYFFICQCLGILIILQSQTY